MNNKSIENKSSETSIQEKVSKKDKEFVKSHTYLTNNEISMLNKNGINLIKELHSNNISIKDITNLISNIFEFHEKKQKLEIKEKIKMEIEAKNFKENVSFNGRDFVYEKFVEIDSYKKVIIQKTFKSKNIYDQWVRMNKKLSSKKESSKQ